MAYSRLCEKFGGPQVKAAWSCAVMLEKLPMQPDVEVKATCPDSVALMTRVEFWMSRQPVTTILASLEATMVDWEMVIEPPVVRTVAAGKDREDEPEIVMLPER